ncbi:MAG: hypothetical protein CBD51_006480 [Flavobacteriales bacterium TMED191]|nr:MAG: hypothetical protein CBD51_006480 [Flavobacteriales bacterium TMED191]|tara:strand:- start:1194 stop:2183 length:990 start_codon:yes stop_codon:yes gene_type:complete
MKNLILLLFPLLVVCQSDKKLYENESIYTVFYNVENLFDTIKSLDTNDNEFLPQSKKKWNTEKYYYKLNQLEKVFRSISEDNNNILPDVIGLSEVENQSVIEDLLKTDLFLNHKYTILHRDSPDDRGIDCALLFNNKFKILENDFIFVDNPESNRSTRDIVYAKLASKSGKVINFFVNHWPSRWGGQKETNHKRVFVAQLLREYIEVHTSKNEHNIIIGDFNDYPSNESLSDFLVKDDFINLMSTNIVSGRGSYNYRGNWNWLDQVIISKDLFDSSISSITVGAFENDFMMYTNEKGKVFPSRSFGGNNWYGGFSDHLPVYCKISFQSK